MTEYEAIIALVVELKRNRLISDSQEQAVYRALERRRT